MEVINRNNKLKGNYGVLIGVVPFIVFISLMDWGLSSTYHFGIYLEQLSLFPKIRMIQEFLILGQFHTRIGSNSLPLSLIITESSYVRYP